MSNVQQISDRLDDQDDQDDQNDLDDLISDWVTVPAAAEQLSVEVTKVRQLLRERQLLGVRRGDRNALHIPAAFLRDGAVVRGLPGTLTLLADARFTDDEALRWLFTPDPSLPGTPVDALAGDRGTEVKRRAQALGF